MYFNILYLGCLDTPLHDLLFLHNNTIELSFSPELAISRCPLAEQFVFDMVAGLRDLSPAVQN